MGGLSHQWYLHTTVIICRNRLVHFFYFFFSSFWAADQMENDVLYNTSRGNSICPSVHTFVCLNICTLLPRGRYWLLFFNFFHFSFADANVEPYVPSFKELTPIFSQNNASVNSQFEICGQLWFIFITHTTRMFSQWRRQNCGLSTATSNVFAFLRSFLT